MKQFRADLHIHTVLSPCGSLDMSPVRIVEQAIAKGLSIIGITDHNTLRQCNEVAMVGDEKGLLVLQGVEIATREEVHCLAFFEKQSERDIFQQFIDDNLPHIANRPDKFGHQVWVNRDEEILGEEPWLLISGLKCSIDEVATKVKALNGIFIAAHIDRPLFSIFSQLGFIDPQLPFDALEMSRHANCTTLMQKYPSLKNYRLYMASDAHTPHDIGAFPSVITANEPTFTEVAMALKGEQGRKIEMILA